MEYWNAALLDKGLLDIKTLRRLDILKVDATPSVSNARHRIDERLRTFGIDLNIHRVDTGKALEQHALAFHDRLARQGPEIAQAKNGGAVGNDRNQVAFAGIAISILGIARDLAHRLGDTRAVSKSKIPSRCGGLGQFHRDFSGNRFGVVIQGCLLIGVCHALFRSFRLDGWAGQLDYRKIFHSSTPPLFKHAWSASWHL